MYELIKQLYSTASSCQKSAPLPNMDQGRESNVKPHRWGRYWFGVKVTHSSYYVEREWGS